MRRRDRRPVTTTTRTVRADPSSHAFSAATPPTTTSRRRPRAAGGAAPARAGSAWSTCATCAGCASRTSASRGRRSSRSRSTRALAEVVEAFKTSTLSRLPVYGETLDQPLGLVHLKDLALVYGFGAPAGDFDLTGLIRPLLYAPPSMPIGVLLQKMQAARIHMALVIDEYGGVDGLVTIEDLLEQVVGDIADEHDEVEGALWTEEAPGVYLVQARMDLDDFEAVAGIAARRPRARRGGRHARRPGDPARRPGAGARRGRARIPRATSSRWSTPTRAASSGCGCGWRPGRPRRRRNSARADAVTAVAARVASLAGLAAGRRVAVAGGRRDGAGAAAGVAAGGAVPGAAGAALAARRRRRRARRLRRRLAGRGRALRRGAVLDRRAVPGRSRRCYGWMAPFALVGMAGGLALFWAAPFALARAVAAGARRGCWRWRRSGRSRTSLRSHVLGGFPWGLVGLRLGRDAGDPGGGAVRPAPARAADAGRRAAARGSRRPGRGLPSPRRWSPPAGASAPGGWRSRCRRGTRRFVVRLVQPDADQREKWQPGMEQVFLRAAPGADRGAGRVRGRT